MIEIDRYDAVYTGSGQGGGSPGRTSVGWGDQVPTTAQARTNLYVRALLFAEGLVNAGVVYRYKIETTARGTWLSGIVGCVPPRIDFFSDDMKAGINYKIAATARTSPTGSTRARSGSSYIDRSSFTEPVEMRSHRSHGGLSLSSRG